MLGIDPRIFRIPVECLFTGPHGQFLASLKIHLSVLYHVPVIVSHLEYKIVSRFGDRESSRV